MKKIVALLIVWVSFATAPAFAGFQEGLDAAENGDYKTALRELRPLAEQGKVEAQYFMGLMYQNGSGIPQDYKEAAKWYTLSAEQGFEIAQFSLGFMYQNGLGVLQNYKEAAKWYTLSAEQGFAPAQGNLGGMYLLGNGVLQDFTLAHMWINIATLNGNENSAKARDKLAELMSRTQIEKAQDLAKKCLAKDYKGC